MPLRVSAVLLLALSSAGAQALPEINLSFHLDAGSVPRLVPAQRLGTNPLDPTAAFSATLETGLPRVAAPLALSAGHPLPGRILPRRRELEPARHRHPRRLGLRHHTTWPVAPPDGSARLYRVGLQ